MLLSPTFTTQNNTFMSLRGQDSSSREDRPPVSLHKKLPIAGYVIGLGDRHSQNILIDSATAAVVHIDLGIAFEQGRFLNTPELVPFRLTRDIVDGMGVTGEAPPITKSVI